MDKVIRPHDPTSRRLDGRLPARRDIHVVGEERVATIHARRGDLSPSARRHTKQLDISHITSQRHAAPVRSSAQDAAERSVGIIIARTGHAVPDHVRRRRSSPTRLRDGHAGIRDGVCQSSRSGSRRSPLVRLVSRPRLRHRHHDARHRQRHSLEIPKRVGYAFGRARPWRHIAGLRRGNARTAAAAVRVRRVDGGLSKPADGVRQSYARGPSSGLAIDSARPICGELGRSC